MTASRPFSRRQVLSWSAAAVGAAALPVQAQSPTKIVFGFTAVNDFASVFVAKEEGYFSKRGLDVEPKFIPLNPSIPAAIQSVSLQMGGPTPSVFLQEHVSGVQLQRIANMAATGQLCVFFSALLSRQLPVFRCHAHGPVVLHAGDLLP